MINYLRGCLKTVQNQNKHAEVDLERRPTPRQLVVQEIKLNPNPAGLSLAAIDTSGSQM